MEPSGDDPNSVLEKGTPFGSFLETGKYPMEQRIEDKKRGIPRQKHPFVGLSILYQNMSLLKDSSVCAHHHHGRCLH